MRKTKREVKFRSRTQSTKGIVALLIAIVTMIAFLYEAWKQLQGGKIKGKTCRVRLLK